RITGVRGILGGLLRRPTADFLWRAAFILGILVGGALIPLFGYTVLEVPFSRGLMAAAGGGLLVGFGTSLGNGCTSGHGVCGISRMSTRSIMATLTFMFFGFISVYFYKFIVGSY